MTYPYTEYIRGYGSIQVELPEPRPGEREKDYRHRCHLAISQKIRETRPLINAAPTSLNAQRDAEALEAALHGRTIHEGTKIRDLYSTAFNLPKRDMATGKIIEPRFPRLPKKQRRR